MSPDEDRQRRFRTYFWMMVVRVAAFGVFFIVPDWWKLIPAALAVFLPFFAVVVANVSTRPTTDGLKAPNALPPGPSAAASAPPETGGAAPRGDVL